LGIYLKMKIGCNTYRIEFEIDTYVELVNLKNVAKKLKTK